MDSQLRACERSMELAVQKIGDEEGVDVIAV